MMAPPGVIDDLKKKRRVNNDNSAANNRRKQDAIILGYFTSGSWRPSGEGKIRFISLILFDNFRDDIVKLTPTANKVYPQQYNMSCYCCGDLSAIFKAVLEC